MCTIPIMKMRTHHATFALILVANVHATHASSVPGPGEPLDFSGRCNEPGHSWDAYWQAYGHFASTDRKAHVLARILVGRIGPRTGDRIAASFEEIRIDTGTSDARIAFRLEGTRGAQTRTQRWSDRYRAIPPGGGSPVTKRYRTDPHGVMRWTRYRGKRRDEEHTYAETLRIDAQGWGGDDAVRLRLRVRIGSSEQVLDGPVVNGIGNFLGLDPPRAKALSLRETLRPGQRGGLWDWLRHGYRYRGCHRWREAIHAAFRRETQEQRIPPSPNENRLSSPP